MAANTPTLRLFCLISGDSTSCAFKVRILDTLVDVSDLKKAIIGEKPNTFEHIDANDLVLWRATIPANDSMGDQHVVKIESLDDKNKLVDPRISLFKVFPETPDDNTYVIVERPRGKSLKKSLADTTTLPTLPTLPTRPQARPKGGKATMLWTETLVEVFAGAVGKSTEDFWYGPYNALLYTYFTLNERYLVRPQTCPMTSRKAADLGVEYLVQNEEGLPVLIVQIKPEDYILMTSKRDEADMQARTRFKQIAEETPAVRQLVVICAIGAKCCVYSGRRDAGGTFDIEPSMIRQHAVYIIDTAPAVWWGIDLLTEAGRQELDDVFTEVMQLRPAH